MTKFIFSVSVLFLIVSCNEKTETLDTGVKIEKSEDDIIKDRAEVFNRQINEEDKEDIKNYLANKNWNVKETGSGIYYDIFLSNDSLKPKSGDFVTLDYLITSLAGDTLYTSDDSGPTSFGVEKEDLESGVHEAVQLLGVGDEGVFIMVNNRAHGVLGDADKILPYQILLYKLKLLSIE